MRDAHDAQRPRPAGVQAVERACRLLDEVIKAVQPLSVGELARATELHQSTTSRLLVSLERHGFVEREGARGRVGMGQGLLRLMESRSSRQLLLEAAEPILKEVGRATNETVNLGVPVPGGVDHIAQVDAPHFLATTNWVGRVIPLHCSSTGKVFLAFGTVEIPKGPLEQLTAATLTDRSELEAELALVRRRGFATLIDELEPGLRAVATPVTGRRGEVVAALAVSGPAVRLPKRRLHHHAELLAQASAALSARITPAFARREAAARQVPSGE
jgi:IclR family acetate operon transcriptional repressor